MSVLGTLVAMVLLAGGRQVESVSERSPEADPRATVVAGDARFTVLTPALVRMEWSPTRMFEDRASFVFINRRLPVPAYTSRREDGWLIIATDELTVRYKENSGRFTADNLRVELTVAGQPVVWKPGTPDTGNLRGTTRTLDGVSGACPLEPGLLSRDGWTLVDDSQRLLFDGQSPPWVTTRRPLAQVQSEAHGGEQHGDAQDWYFFGYGRDYQRLLGDYVKVAGRIPLPPRFVFGAWWSRYWAYTDEELKTLVNEFAAHDVPLDVLVVDMDWHLDGWTGYTWNPQYFPDPAGFLAWMRERGLRVTLNLHPHDGVGRHEAAFRDVADFLGLDPQETERVPFDCADPKYMAAYFKFLHHPYEEMGVDFWWTDWQQGEETKVPGLDPLFWLNHLHWQDMAANPARAGKRPLIFSRWGGLGNHRYQVGFSGDTYCNWASLAFQPYFTATAGNVGYAYWSHDIGGHQPGKVDPELYTRWVQFGAFSPVLRTHTTKNPQAERRIWAFPDEYFQAMRAAFKLRYELIPYIYTMARKCSDTGIPLCRPLYYEWPELDEAYAHPGEYLFGDDLLVAPVMKPANPLSGVAEVEVWLPPGRWINWFTDAMYDGPKAVAVQVPLDEVPVFARAGAIISAAAPTKRSDEITAAPLVLHVFPGQSGATTLYEDDGVSVNYERGGSARTLITQAYDGERCIVTVHPMEGRFPGMPAERACEIRLHAFWPKLPGGSVLVNGRLVERAQAPGEVGWWFDPSAMCFVVRTPTMNRSEPIEVALDIGLTYSAQTWSGCALQARMRALDDVEAILGDGPQPGNVGAAEVREELRSGSSYDEAVAGSVRAWAAMLERIERADLAPITKTKALVRLFGLVASTGFHAGAGASEGVRFSFAMSLGQYVPSLDGVSARTSGEWSATVQLDDPVNWRAILPAKRRFSSTSRGDVVRGDAQFAPDGAFQTTRLRGAFAVSIGQDVTIEVPLDLVLLPSINRWWIVGPFDAPDDDRLQASFPPEEQPLDLRATYAGKDAAAIAWRKVERIITPESDLTDEFFVEFHKVFDAYQQNAVAYALVYLHAPRDLDAVLALGSDDGIVVWLNDEEIHRHDVGRPYTSREDRVPLRLLAGPNKLMLKISQGGGMWGFAAHLEDSAGQAIPEVTAHFEP